MEKKNQKLLIIVGVLLLVGGVSLAYFVSNILTNGNGGNIKATTAVIKGARIDVEGLLSFEDLDIYPGHKVVSSIKITATGNNELIPYNLIWQGTNSLTTPLELTVYKTSEEIDVSSKCNKKTKVIGGTQQLSEECTISNIDKLGTEIATVTINKNDSKVTLVKDEFVTAVNNGISYYYYVILEYPNLDEPQNEDLTGAFDGEVTVEESNIKPDINILAAYVIQEDGTYKEVDDIPQEGYTINKEKSTCSNGANVRWDYLKKELITSNLTKSGTSCYLYFDEYVPPITIPDIITNATKGSGIPNFSKTACTIGCEEITVGTYTVSDGMYGGTSIYWRGDTTDNYVKFANFCWRIVRINGDGTIRLIYDGTTCHANGTSTAESIAVASTAYNSSTNQSNYVGWTYSGTLQRPANNATATFSNAKTQLESWYSSNITGTNAEKIAQGKYCNDRDAQSGNTWAIASGSPFYYAAYKRIRTDYAPTLTCPNGDAYILSVGLITADEVAYAGGKNRNNNLSYYLCNGQDYWTISPEEWDSGIARMFYVQWDGKLPNNYVDSAAPGLRPVINLKANTTFKSDGNGTLNNPYEVAD